MVELKDIDHIAIICSDYEKSKAFYTSVLGLQVVSEVYRAERDSYKLDLSLNGRYIVELFSFPDPPPRKSYPESAGLRHLSFIVEDLDVAISELDILGVKHEPIRIDEYTKKRFIFLFDPDNLPIEFYERATNY